MAIIRTTRARRSEEWRRKQPQQPWKRRVAEARVCSTDWASNSTMEKHGIKRDVAQLLESMGLPGLENFHYPTYYTLTREFFETLEIIPGESFSYITDDCLAYFNIGKQTYTFTCGELCEAWNFPNDRRKRYEGLLRRYQVWKVMTGETWDEKNAHWLKIRNPALRYVAKLLSNTLMARSFPGNIKKDELSLLYRGLARNFEEREPERIAVNNAYLFLRNILDYRDELKKSKDLITLCFGGMLVPLFINLGIELEDFHPIPYIRGINEELLERGKSGKRGENGEYYHIWNLQGTQMQCELPLTGFSCFLTPENVAFKRPRDRALISGASRQRTANIGWDSDSDDYSSSSNDEAPVGLDWEREDTPTPPENFNPAVGQDWAHYTNARFEAHERELKRVRRIARWSYDQHIKSKERLRRFKKEIKKRRPQPQARWEEGHPLTDEESRQSYQEGSG